MLLKSERRSWLQDAPEVPRPLLVGMHGPLLNEMALACGQDHGLAKALQQRLPFVGVLPWSMVLQTRWLPVL